jgi:hypothetical protein
MTSVNCWCGGQVVQKPVDPPIYACSDSVYHDPHADGRPEQVTKLYVAGPMSGYPECNYPLFNKVSEQLRSHGYEVVNPATVHIDKQHHYVDLIREDLRMMLDCHGVAVLEHWWESAGARNEVAVAGILKMPVRSHLEWVHIARRSRYQNLFTT